MDDPETSLPRPADGVVYSRVSEGGVLLATEEEVYYGLNEAGARAWEGLREAGTVGELCSRLRDAYPDVDPATLRADVEELLEDLVRQGLLVEPSDPARGSGAPDVAG